MFRKVFLVLILGLSLPTHSWGATHYVKIGGSDGAAGTSWATAWATISKVNSGTSGGDTVYFGTGVWRGQLLPVSGTAEDRTTYACSSFVRGITSIWGSDSITGWVQHSGNVYKAAWTPGNCFSEGAGYVAGQIDATYDTFLTPVASIPSSAGKFYYNTTTDTIYVWCYGGGNPSTKDIESSCRPVIYLTGGQDYCTFWGFDLRYGSRAIVLFYSGGCNYNYIDHCNIFGVGGANQDNNSCVGSAAEMPMGQHNRVRACSLGFSYDVDMDAWRFGVCPYYQRFFVTESCVVVGGVVDGINYKSGNDSSVIRFNTIKGCAWSGINLHADPVCDSIYGNIIIGSGSSPVAGIRCYSKYAGGVDNFIANNTIYNVKYAGFESGVEGSLNPPNYYKYNIVSTIYDITDAGSGGGFEYLKDADSLTWTIDSNLYDNPDTGFGINWSSRALTYWRETLGHDVHTRFYDPGFTDAANGDFSRPTSSQEMHSVTYGGKTWTRFGAWQPGGDEQNHCPTSPTLDGDTVFEGVNPTLSLNNSSDPDPGDVLVYDFQVYDSQLVNVVANVANVAQGQNITSWQVNPELPDESWYWWRARSYDSMCHSDWSGNRKFYVKTWIANVNLGDSQPDLKSPAKGAVLANLRPTLEVYSITGFDSLWYYYQLDSDSQFTSPIPSEAVTEKGTITSWTVSDLLSAGNYCWRVRAFDGSQFSLWSESRKFTLAPEIYAYPSPFKPSAGDEKVIFNNIPIASNIRITTLNGELIREFTNTGESQIFWDVKNQKNKDVASGIYLYFIDFVGGSTSGKIIVIR